MKKLGAKLLIPVMAFMPVMVFAEESGDFGQINTFIGKITGFINGTLLPLIFGIALLVFVYGVFKYFILGGSDEGSRQEGRQLVLYAIIGFILMTSIWGIVNILSDGLGLNSEEATFGIPDVPGTGE